MKKLIIICTLFIWLPAANAQTTRANTINLNTWLMYFGNHMLSEKIGWHSEIQWRRNDLLAKSQQLLLRTGVDVYSPKNYRMTFGYAFIQTYPYGEFATANAFPEHRIWEQLLTWQIEAKSSLPT